MLKIKDNVDLKELEKFGFKKSAFDNLIYNFSFTININTRKIVYVGCDFELLFDLIKADLVEKVGD